MYFINFKPVFFIYSEKDHKYAINGYLQDWREWKGENSEAISHLFKCLRLVEREDIVYEICNKFREGTSIYISSSQQY
jgi:hypothetical protein